MWIGGYWTNTACNPDNRAGYCAGSYGDAGNADYDANAETNLDAETDTRRDAAAPTAADADSYSTRFSATDS